MRKLLVIGVLILASLHGLCQYPTPYQNQGAPTIAIRNPGGQFIIGTFVPPVYFDTATANAQPNTNLYKGSFIFTTSDNTLWVRDSTATVWLTAGAGSGGTGIRDTVYVEFPLGVRWDSTGHQVIFLRRNGLMDGGVITLDSCMRINITAPTYNINYQQYVGLPTTLTIDDAHASLNRVDIIVADTFGLVYAIKGTPALLAQPPPHNPSFQFVLGEIPVEAGITCLNIGVKTVWDEDLGTPDEWDLTTEGAIAADPDNTDNPYHLTKAIFVESYVDSTQLIFTHTSEVDTVTSTSVLKAYLYLNGLFDNAIQVQYFLDTVPVSNNLVINPFFNVLDSNNYQNVSIPFNEWNFFGGAYYNKVVVTLRGWDSSGAKGFYLDWITIQNGISQSAGQKVYVDSVTVAGDSLFYWKNGINFYGGAAGGGGGGGTVTIVTGTSPIIITSIPTTTPNVTIQQANGSQGGYLSSTDWNTFNNKINGIDNIGTGFNWVEASKVNVKRAGAGNGILIDSTTAANTNTFKADTAVLATQNFVINDRVNLIAGTNISITGTYPSLTINASGSAQTTIDETITATAGQTAFTFTTVPASYADYEIHVNGSKWDNTTGYTTSGNVVTLTTPLLVGDLVNYHRIK